MTTRRTLSVRSPEVDGRPALASGGYVSLGALKANRGDQNYTVPPGTDLSRFRAAAIWCRRFGVNFTTATLAEPAPEP